MGLREWANAHPKAVAGVVGGLVVLAGGAAVIQAVAGRRGYPNKPPDSYFTADDGRTWFLAPSTSYPPFDHTGQVAVHAYVFQSPHGKKFVGYLERFAADVRPKLDATHPPTPYQSRFGREIKRPGEATWTRTGDMATENRIENVASPDGDNATLEEVEP